MKTVTIPLDYFDSLREFENETKKKNSAQILIGYEGWRREWFTSQEVKEQIIKEVEEYFKGYAERYEAKEKGSYFLSALKYKIKNIFK
jgi:GH35 family endo-1,4-beta-xylanase